MHFLKDVEVFSPSDFQIREIQLHSNFEASRALLLLRVGREAMHGVKFEHRAKNRGRNLTSSCGNLLLIRFPSKVHCILQLMKVLGKC